MTHFVLTFQDCGLPSFALQPDPHGWLGGTWSMQSSPVEVNLFFLKHVIVPDLELIPICEENSLPNTCSKKSATHLGAKRLVAEDAHGFTMEEIHRRKALGDVFVKN